MNIIYGIVARLLVLGVVGLGAAHLMSLPSNELFGFRSLLIVLGIAVVLTGVIADVIGAIRERTGGS